MFWDGFHFHVDGDSLQSGPVMTCNGPVLQLCWSGQFGQATPRHGSMVSLETSGSKLILSGRCFGGINIYEPTQMTQTYRCFLLGSLFWPEIGLGTCRILKPLAFMFSSQSSKTILVFQLLPDTSACCTGGMMRLANASPSMFRFGCGSTSDTVTELFMFDPWIILCRQRLRDQQLIHSQTCLGQHLA